MATDAKGLVLMKKENGILEQELGSYEILDGLELVFKAYVEGDTVKLFLTTPRDVNDEEYNEIFDGYEAEPYEAEGFTLSEVEEEYNPVWCITCEYSEDHEDMHEDLNYIIGSHKKQMEKLVS
jgi:hypothetical protein